MFKPERPLPVFTYFSLSVAAIVAALVACLAYWPEDVPTRESLIKIGGDVQTVQTRDSISGSGAGIMLPILKSTYFRFPGMDGEFRYPWTFPKYRRVERYTAVNVEIWVEEAAIGRDKAPLIWALQENNPFKDDDQQTSVDYDNVAASQVDMTRNLIKFCLYMVAASVILAIIGMLVTRWNRKNYPDYGL